MKKLLAILALLLIVAIGAYCLCNTEARRVRRRFDALAEAVSKESGEGNIAMVIKMETLGNLLDEKVTIRLREYPYEPQASNSELVSLATRGRTFFKELSISIVDVESTFDTKEYVFSRCTAKIKGTGKNDQQIYDEFRHFSAELCKRDGKWRFCVFQEENMLKR